MNINNMLQVFWSIGYLEVALASLCFFILWALRQERDMPWNWPIVGMLPATLYYIDTIHENATEVLGRAGGTFLIKGPWFANMDMLGTGDPANVHHIMSGNFINFPKGSKFMEIFEVLGDGIFNSDGETWRSQRKVARSLINHRRFHSFLVKTSVHKVQKSLVPVLDHVAKIGSVLDLQDLFQRLTFDTSCIMITGYDPGCVSVEFPNVPFSKAMDDAEEAIFFRDTLPENLWKLMRWLNIGTERKLAKAWPILDAIIIKYINMKRVELGIKNSPPGTRANNNEQEEEEEEGADLLTSYISDEKSLGIKCDNKFLRDTILNLMIAGRDTTSSALTWFIWLISTHPEAEAKIREELKSVISQKEEAEKWRLFNPQEVNNLVYLHAALCETLRLYPPVPFQHKEPVKPEFLPSGHYVHPKLKVFFSLYAMGRLEMIWGNDCKEFKPERWISERGTIKHEPSYKFLAFNAGPRTCLGKEVAFTQMKAVAAAIIHNYNVKVVEGHCVVPNVSIILYMKHGFKVRVSKRWA